MPNFVHRAYMFQVDLSRLSLHSRYTFNAPNICSESGADSEERLGTREQGRAKNSSWCADALFVISRFKLTYAFRFLFRELPDRPRSLKYFAAGDLWFAVCTYIHMCVYISMDI